MKIYDYNGKKNICGERIREARLKQRYHNQISRRAFRSRA